MEFFADRNLGRHVFPGVLRSAGLTVHVHDDHFPDDEPDESWLPEVAARGWIVLSSDRRILTRPLQVEAAMTSGAAVLILVGGSMKAADRAQNLVNTYAKVADFVAHHTPPYLAKLYRPTPVEAIQQGKPGSIEMALSFDEWRRRGDR